MGLALSLKRGHRTQVEGSRSECNSVLTRLLSNRLDTGMKEMKYRWYLGFHQHKMKTQDNVAMGSSGVDIDLVNRGYFSVLYIQGLK